jgi:hypothetical protein
MRDNRPYGSEGGDGNLPDPYHQWECAGDDANGNQASRGRTPER